MRLSRLLLICCLLLPPLAGAEGIQRSVDLSMGESMDLRIFPAAASKDILLWLPCDQGLGIAEVGFAKELSSGGQAVWLADLLGMYFLPMAPSSMRQISGEEILELLELIRAEDGRPVYLVSAGYGSIPTLRGARLWKEKYAGQADEDYVAGIILLYPELTASEPEPGRELDYVPVVTQTSTPLYIMQPELTPARFWLHRLTALLEQGGASVETQLLPKVRGYFYIKEDANEAEVAMAADVPRLVLEARDRLAAKRATPNKEQ